MLSTDLETLKTLTSIFTRDKYVFAVWVICSNCWSTYKLHDH